MKQKLKIAQIGVRHEHAAGKMLTARRRMSDVVEMVGVAAESPDDEKTYSADTAYSGIPWMSKEDIFKIPGLDAVFVESEMTDLVDTARLCLEHGMPVHFDKPGGELLEPYAELVRDFDKAGIVFQPAYMLRGSHSVNFLRKAHSRGWLGEIFEVDGNMNRYDVDPKFRTWLSGYKGGGMFDFGSHIIDVLISLLGAPDDILSFQKHLCDDALFDNGLAVFVYPKALATLRCAQVAPDPARHRRMTVRGTRGIIEISPLEQGFDPKHGYPEFDDVPVNVHMVLLDDNDEFKSGTHDLKIGPMTDRYEDMLRDFVRLVRGEMKNPYTAEYEVTLQKAILAASGYIKWRD